MITTTVSKVKPGTTIGVPTYSKEEEMEHGPNGYVGERILEPMVKVTQGHQSVYINRDTYREIKRQLGK